MLGRCLLLGVALLAPPSVAGAAEACRCDEQSPQRAWNRAQAVFVGEVAEAAGGEAAGVRLRVAEALKNFEAGTVVEVSASRRAACAVRFEPGRRYLVYAQGSASEGWTTDRCSRTRPLAEAEADLVALEEGTPHMGGVGDALRLPVIDHREQPWGDLSWQDKNELSYWLVSLEAFLNEEEASSRLAFCRELGAPEAEQIEANLTRFRRRAARYLAKGREIAATGLSAEQMRGGPLTPGWIREQREQGLAELTVIHEAWRAEPERGATACRFQAQDADVLVELIYPIRTDPRYRW